jgi:hypothetical protein
MKFVARAIADGTDFIGTDIFRKEGIPAGRSGLGDAICEISNLINYGYDTAEVVVPKFHPAFKNLLNLYDINGKYNWKLDSNFYNGTKIYSTIKEIEEKTGYKVLHCYPEFKEYAKLDKSKFIKTDLPKEPYATIQRTPFAKKCLYTEKHIKYMESQYDIKIIEIGGKENLGLERVAYIIDNAEFHIGIDSGLTHFALTIKDINDVHIYVPEDRITGVTYRWLHNEYNVKLMER